MTILYVITQGEMGGAQNYVATLARAAKSQNMAVEVAIGEKGDNWLGREIEALGGKTWLLKRLVRPISPLSDLLAIFELAKLYRNIKPDIIHLNSTKAGIIGSLASVVYSHKLRATSYKLIYTAHGWVFNEPMSLPKKWLYKTLEKITSRIKNKIICVSEYDRRVALGEKIAPADRLMTIHNGIDTDLMDFLPKKEAIKKIIPDFQFPIANLPIIIGVIANFYPTKGLNYLIDATNIMITDYRLPIIAIIIGDGDLRAQLEQQIKRLKLENNVFLVGQLKNAARYLKAFDIAVMSSVKEGFPYFLLEAMAAGLPIVATKVGGIPEIVENRVTGFLAEAKNEKDLADKLKGLAEKPELRQKMGEAGLLRVKKKINQEKMVRETFSLYQR